MKRFLKWAAITVGMLILLLILVVGAFLGLLRCSGEHEWKADEILAQARRHLPPLVTGVGVEISRRQTGRISWRGGYRLGPAVA